MIASALAHARRNPTEDSSREWLSPFDDSITECSAFPDAGRVDLGSEQGFVNRVILHDLVPRNQRNADLTAGIPKMIARARSWWRQH